LGEFIIGSYKRNETLALYDAEIEINRFSQESGNAYQKFILA
jgi:hypothetical protein